MAAPVILVTAYPRRVSDGAIQVQRLAGGGDGQPYYYGGEHYRAGVMTLSRFSAELTFGQDGWTGGAMPQTGIIQYATADAAFRDTLAGLYWGNASIVIQSLTEGGAIGTDLTGTALGATSGPDGVISITVADLSAGMDRPLLTSRFAGTGGVEGALDQAGRLKRRSWGRCYNVEARLIDKVNNIYEVGDPARPLRSIVAVRDKGMAASALMPVEWQGSVSATFAALQAAYAPDGGGAVAPSIACIKWWTRPDSPLTADLLGEIGTGYVETIPEIIERISSGHGGPSIVNLPAAIALRPDAAGVHVDHEDQTIASVLDHALAGVSLLWVLDPTGAIEIREWSWGAPVAALRSAQVQRDMVLQPIRSRRIGYQTNRHVHGDGEIVAALLPNDRGDYSLLSTYYQMDLVRWQDGRRYKYINPNPSAGNPPPSVSYWELHEEAPGAIVIVDLPPIVEEFGVTVLGNTGYFGLKPVSGRGLSHYIVKFQPVVTGASWPNAVIMLPRLPLDATGFSLPAMNGSYLIKAVNVDGAESADAAITSINVLTLNALNVVATITESPTFAGVKDNVISDLAGLVLTGGLSWDDWPDVDAVADVDFGMGSAFVGVGHYYFSNTLDLGAIYTSRLTASLQATGTDTRSTIDLVPDIDAMPAWDGADPTAWNIELQVQTSDDGAVFGPWRTFVIGDYTSRAFRWRVRMLSLDSNVTPVLVAASVTVDMPDRTLAGEDVICPAGGMTVTFDTPFRAVPAIAITGQNLATGDYFTVTAKTQASFFIRFFNSSGAGISRTFDYVAKGYGVQA